MLPKEIIDLIFSFDPTYHLIYQQIVQQLKYDFNYVNGIVRSRVNKFTGHHVFYDMNGMIEKQYFFKNNQFYGFYNVYYRSRPKYQCFYKNGKKNGMSTEYHLNGTLMQQKIYHEDNIISTEIRRYYDNGQLFSITNYKKGDTILKREGLYTVYDKNSGEMKEQFIYKNDKRLSKTIPKK
jgi:antitoxin component YwqK of YwqJK toxin-antitoxin module